ncbi:hypothetical protein HYPSUDRAFT_203851 [Hypholoma sublateritium FD-334 SS-4]|uniref:Uncharacterized protein n=1 Tax=Hypholoma sublateritium (strain FD-334 SS-4) TaxID=945553 RepID=A0A0D2MAG2_HYPSF|nr:hypothetical protein HYPSUDRAFT_203851 [Hypholoma sublateritium FD-334 SS-4]
MTKSARKCGRSAHYMCVSIELGAPSPAAPLPRSFYTRAACPSAYTRTSPATSTNGSLGTPQASEALVGGCPWPGPRGIFDGASHSSHDDLWDIKAESRTELRFALFNASTQQSTRSAVLIAPVSSALWRPTHDLAHRDSPPEIATAYPKNTQPIHPISLPPRRLIPMTPRLAHPSTRPRPATLAYWTTSPTSRRCTATPTSELVTPAASLVERRILQIQSTERRPLIFDGIVLPNPSTFLSVLAAAAALITTLLSVLNTTTRVPSYRRIALQ